MASAALATAAMVSGGLAAAPAHADSSTISVSVFGYDTVLGVSGIGKDLSAGLNVSASSPTGTATNVTLAVDFSGLAGMATITTSNPACSASGTVITCDFGTIDITHYLAIPSPLVQIHLTPVAGAQVGQAGQYTLTGSADGVAPFSVTQNVTLADGPDLTGSGYEVPDSNTPPVQVALKSKVSSPKLTVTNAGSSNAEGVTITFNSVYEFPLIDLARNCDYAASPYSYGRLLFASCYFPNVLTPSDVYTLTNPQRFTVGPDTIHNFESIFSAHVVPGYQPPSAVDSTLKWVAGTEDPLVLIKTSGPGTPTTTPDQVTQTNIDPYDDWNNLVYQASNGISTDLAAIGAKVEAPKGSTVNVTVGVHNNGPGTEDFGPALLDAAGLQFTPPPGTTVTTVPSNCFLANNGAYECSMGQMLRFSTSAKVTFTLQVSATGATGEGKVFVYHGQNGETPSGSDVYDTVWTNNVAAVRIAS